MPHRLARSAGRRLYTPASRSIVLRRDLDRPLSLPAAKVPITVRAAGEADHAAIVALLAELSGTDRTQRERFLELPIGTCSAACA